MKILTLEKRGCDFWEDEKLQSDCENFRICTPAYTIKGKDGKTYFLEFSLWRNRGHLRTTNKKGTKALKHPVFEIDIKEGMAISASFEDKEGTWGNSQLEAELHKMFLSYTKADILKAVNFISKDTYNKIKFVKRG